MGTQVNIEWKSRTQKQCEGNKQYGSKYERLQLIIRQKWKDKDRESTKKSDRKIHTECRKIKGEWMDEMTQTEELSKKD